MRASFWLLYGLQNGAESRAEGSTPTATSTRIDEGSPAARADAPADSPAGTHPDTSADGVAEYLSWIGIDDGYISSALELIAVAQAVAASTTTATISAARYEQLRADVLNATGQVSRKGVALWPVTSQTIMKRIGGGSWADALAQLGVGVSGRGRARVGLRFTESDYVEAIAAFVDAAASDSRTPSYSAYTRWVTAQKDAGLERPSGSAIRAHFGSWGAALAGAAAAH